MIERTRRSLSKKRIKKVRVRTLFLLALTLIFNTYAWFMYKTTVSGNIHTHVSAWSVDFAIDNKHLEKEVRIDIPEAYPGMEDVEKVIDVTNYGEQEVDLSVELTGLRILNDTYVISEDGEPGTYTEAEILEMLEEDFPFHLSIIQEDNFLALDGTSNVTVLFTWDFEENPDENDTFYGSGAYAFYTDEHYNYEPAISLEIKIIASQHAPTT